MEGNHDGIAEHVEPIIPLPTSSFVPIVRPLWPLWFAFLSDDAQSLCRASYNINIEIVRSTRMRRIFALISCALLASTAAFAQHQHSTAQTGASAAAAKISGDYLETRSADVYTGPCFANGEVNLAGDEAILAWHINQGTWQGENLAGLTVVSAVKASATLGDPFATAGPVRSVMIVDEHANAAHRMALV